jgi:hypothetical protein
MGINAAACLSKRWLVVSSGAPSRKKWGINNLARSNGRPLVVFEIKLATFVFRAYLILKN